MRVNASAGRDKKKDLRDYCYKLTLTAVHPNPVDADLEGELLSRLYKTIRDGGSANLLRYLRKTQKHKSYLAKAKP